MSSFTDTDCRSSLEPTGPNCILLTHLPSNVQHVTLNKGAFTNGRLGQASLHKIRVAGEGQDSGWGAAGSKTNDPLIGPGAGLGDEGGSGEIY